MRQINYTCTLLTLLGCVLLAIHAAPAFGAELSISAKERAFRPLPAPIDDKSLVISPDGRHFAYQSNEKRYVVLDGVAGNTFDYFVGNDSLCFSPDSKHLAYIAGKGLAGKECVVQDGVAGKTYRGVMAGTPTFNSKNQLAYIIGDTNGQYRVVYNDTEGKAYQQIGKGPWTKTGKGDIVFSIDGAHIAYVVTDNKNQFVVVDNVEGNSYEKTGYLTFSSNGTLGYIAVKNNTWRIILDGKETVSSAEPIIALVWNPDGTHYSYVTKDAKNMTVTINGKRQKGYNLVTPPKYNPDGTRVAYGARDGKSMMVVVDGKEQKKYDIIAPPIFSPDGQHIAYGALQNGQFCIVEDGVEKYPCRAYAITSMAYSPDSKHLACWRWPTDEGWRLMVDGKEGSSYDLPLSDAPIVFDSPPTLHALAMRDNGVLLISFAITQ